MLSQRCLDLPCVGISADLRKHPSTPWCFWGSLPRHRRSNWRWSVWHRRRRAGAACRHHCYAGTPPPAPSLASALATAPLAMQPSPRISCAGRVTRRVRAQSDILLLIRISQLLPRELEREGEKGERERGRERERERERVPFEAHGRQTQARTVIADSSRAPA